MTIAIIKFILIFVPILLCMYFNYVDFNRDALMGWTTALIWAGIAYNNGFLC